MTKRILCFLSVVLLSRTVVVAQVSPGNKDTINTKLKRISLPSFYLQQPSFFCKKELQLQKLTKLNVFVRLGSKDWVDYLEQKPNAIRKH